VRVASPELRQQRCGYGSAQRCSAVMCWLRVLAADGVADDEERLEVCCGLRRFSHYWSCRGQAGGGRLSCFRRASRPSLVQHSTQHLGRRNRGSRCVWRPLVAVKERKHSQTCQQKTTAAGSLTRGWNGMSNRYGSTTQASKGLWGCVLYAAACLTSLLPRPIARRASTRLSSKRRRSSRHSDATAASQQPGGITGQQRDRLDRCAHAST
jgi:hypothetical protein